MDMACINEQYLPLMEVPPTVLDRGLYFGDGVYEVIRTYDGRIFALDEHLQRFARSLHEIQIRNVDIPAVSQKIQDAFARSGYVNAKIYFHITRGSELRDHLPAKDLSPNFFLTVQQLKDNPQVKQQGIKVSTFPDWRWKRCDIKSLNLLPNILARIDADKKGCCEAILVNDADEITEGAGSAFFAIDGKEKILITRPLGPEILPSITRMMVMQIAQNCGLTPVEKTISPAQAAAMDELFIAVTTKDVVPIVQFDGNPIGNGIPGPCTQQLMTEFTAMALST